MYRNEYWLSFSVSLVLCISMTASASTLAAPNDVAVQELDAVVSLRKAILDGPYGAMLITDLASKALEERGPRCRDMRLALLMRKNEAVPELVRRLKGSSDDDTYDVLMLIQGNLRWREATPHILLLLEDKERSERVRGRAATAAAVFGAREALPAIRELLQEAQEIQVRQMAIMALGVLQDSNSVDLLQTALEDESPYVQIRAAMALGMLGCDVGEAVALELSYDKSFGMRCLATEALSHIRSEEAIKRLNEMLEHDPSPTVRREVEEHLGRIEIENMSKENAIRKLEELLASENPNPPRWAFKYLVDHFGPEATPILRRLTTKRGRLTAPAAKALIYVESDVVHMPHKKTRVWHEQEDR